MSIAIYGQRSYAYHYEFTGNNGDPPDSNVWVPGAFGDDNDRASIFNNTLRFESPEGASEYSHYRSVFCLSGEFDMQISFYITTLTAVDNNTSARVAFGFGFGDYILANYIERQYSTFGSPDYGDVYFAKTNYTSGNYDLNEDDMVGEFRIKRTIHPENEERYLVTFWYYDHETGYWIFEGDNEGWTEGSPRGAGDCAYVMMLIQNPGGEVDARFSSFHITSGTLVWP